MTFDSAEMGEIATRRLRYAIAASFVLHLLLLWPDAPRLLSKDAASPLQATLRARTQPAAASAGVSQDMVRPRHVPEPQDGSPREPVKPSPVLASPVPMPAPPSLESTGPVPVPKDSGTPARSPGGPGPAPVLSASAAPTTGGTDAMPADAPRVGEAADALRGYRLAVASQARRFKRYPAYAMSSGWTGTADIRVEVGTDGRPRPATVQRSSGHEVLDRAAQAMIDAGALRAHLPDSLRGRTFAVVLPVVFNLDEE